MFEQYEHAETRRKERSRKIGFAFLLALIALALAFGPKVIHALKI